MQSCVAEMEKVKTRARSLLVVVSTPPTENYGSFTAKVKEYNSKEPFNFLTPTIFRDLDFQKVCCVRVTGSRSNFSNCFPSSLSP